MTREIRERGYIFSVSIPQHMINNVSTCYPHSQILCLATVLLLNLDLSFSGKAAKELHVLYAKIAGSYFILPEPMWFPETDA